MHDRKLEERGLPPAMRHWLAIQMHLIRREHPEWSEEQIQKELDRVRLKSLGW